MHYFEMKKKSNIFWGRGIAPPKATPTPPHLLGVLGASTPPLLFLTNRTLPMIHLINFSRVAAVQVRVKRMMVEKRQR